MSPQKRGLGRGLGALIPTEAPTTERASDAFFAPTGAIPVVAGAQDGPELMPVPGATFAYLDPASIVPNPRQPRQVFDEAALAELVASVKEIGVLQPVVVRPVGDRFELIMGERRLRASREAGLEAIPAIVRNTDDTDMLRDALVENLHRSQLNPLEEAAAYQQLLDDFGITHEQLAERIARSRPQISNTLRLLKLPPTVQKRLAAGVLSAGHARALLSLEDAGKAEALADRIVKEGLSVRATEEAVALGVKAKSGRGGGTVRAGSKTGALDELGDRLGDRLDTRVKVALGRGKGTITIEFATVEDLNRIIELIDPSDPGVLKKR